jgi:hypothetical protein
MGRLTEKTVTGASSSNWVPLDHHLHPFAVGFGVVVGASGTTYTVQHTFHDIFIETSVIAYDHSDVSGETTNVDGNYAYPVAAVRLTCAGSGDSATLRIYQAGN